MITALPRLNCDGCVKCCIQDTIVLQPRDNPANFKTRLVDGERVLKKNADGNCVYLGRRGCKIHTRQPIACRLFDCRQYFLKVQSMTEEERAERYENPLLRMVLEEGEKRLLEATREKTD